MVSYRVISATAVWWFGSIKISNPLSDDFSRREVTEVVTPGPSPGESFILFVTTPRNIENQPGYGSKKPARSKARQPPHPGIFRRSNNETVHDNRNDRWSLYLCGDVRLSA